MKKLTSTILMGSMVSAGTAALLLAAYKKRNGNVEVLEDLDMRNSGKLDEMESVDADKVPEEQGLTQLDSTYRNEWVANGFPQTHQEMKELEEAEKEDTLK
ncbi:hypothetical protein [Peribacillus kribbensis]|uniref:hypothetical protein n=1 Tax=Peribacillus kribbensis TaxID=356658 RepID=UPI0004037692|nr:hypothetical protein [Peribacillus kribbensis]